MLIKNKCSQEALRTRWDLVEIGRIQILWMTLGLQNRALQAGGTVTKSQKQECGVSGVERSEQNTEQRWLAKEERKYVWSTESH